jgi:cell division septation protein DedD
MIAIKRLQSIMWILVVAAGALAAYLISLRVATERNAVHHMIDQIRWTRAEIRYLEAEFGARGSMRQLSSWNQNDLRLYVPSQSQYLPNERALANLDRIEPAGDGYAPPPVMTAMATQTPAQQEASTQTPVEAKKPKVAKPIELAEAKPIAPKPAERKPAASATARAASSEFALIRTASAAEPRVIKDAPKIRTAAADKFIKPAGQPDPAARKAARLALLDAKLLGVATSGKAR